MKVVFSRKGFDSAAGKCPSPIIDGRPMSMPIPASKSSATTYADLGLGDIVEKITRNRMSGNDLCHHDPMFRGGECHLGQCGAAQAHLEKQGVGVGDVFLFFGLFAEPGSLERHHRFFGYLRVDRLVRVADIGHSERAAFESLRHPHVLGREAKNDVIYSGEGATARSASSELRLTRQGGPLSSWEVPSWLEGKGLTYHAKPWRWAEPGHLQVVSRGQEFVSDTGEDAEARDWVEAKIAAMNK